jgi:hypothetical protein
MPDVGGDGRDQHQRHALLEPQRRRHQGQRHRRQTQPDDTLDEAGQQEDGANDDKVFDRPHGSFPSWP